MLEQSKLVKQDEWVTEETKKTVGCVAHFKPLWGHGQPWLNCAFQASQGYILKTLSHLPTEGNKRILEANDVLIVWENF